MIQANRADPTFSYCISGDGCPPPSPLSTSVSVPVPQPVPAVADTAPSKAVAPKPLPKPGPTLRASNVAVRTATGVAIAFAYKSAIFPAGAGPLLEHWLKAKDQPGSRYLVIVHTEDSGPISRKLAQDRGDAVSQAIRQLLPPKQLDRTSVFDTYGRQVVVAIEPITPSPNPTSAASLAPPPKPIPASRGESTPEKTP